MGFDYLTSVGNLLFYDLFLGPLTKDALETADRENVKLIRIMGSEDFKVVRDQYSFYPKADINHGILIEDLAKKATFIVYHNKLKRLAFIQEGS